MNQPAPMAEGLQTEAPPSATRRPGCLPCPHCENRHGAGYYCRHPQAATSRRGLPVAALIGTHPRITPGWCPVPPDPVLQVEAGE